MLQGQGFQFAGCQSYKVFSFALDNLYGDGHIIVGVQKVELISLVDSVAESFAAENPDGAGSGAGGDGFPNQSPVEGIQGRMPGVIETGDQGGNAVASLVFNYGIYIRFLAAEAVGIEACGLGTGQSDLGVLGITGAVEGVTEEVLGAGEENIAVQSPAVELGAAVCPEGGAGEADAEKGFQLLRIRGQEIAFSLGIPVQMRQGHE